MNNTEIQQEELKDHQIRRREVMLGLGAVASTLAFSGNTMAEMSGHDHSKHSAKYPAVLDAASNCTDKGYRCLAHCLAAWNHGNLDLAECANKVNEMIAVCGGFTMLLASNSSYVNEYAKMCSSVCKDCADECRKHDDHLECRECAEACEELIDQIKINFA